MECAVETVIRIFKIIAFRKIHAQRKIRIGENLVYTLCKQVHSILLIPKLTAFCKIKSTKPKRAPRILRKA